MERYLLRDDIWWVGAIDWDVRDFHGYETPRGTTYNAYLVLDDKVALVDGCRDGFGPQMLARVRGCCGLRPVDYMVINHIEPDHSGAIPFLLENLHPEKIFCSRRAKEALAFMFSADWVQKCDLQVVGTGDELNLGRKTLQFIEAPMLHWPDSMFTYVKEAKTLLPNDAFGQHLAHSRRFADEVDQGDLMEEASKYYANILMPFASPIAKMLDKIAEMGLEIETIAPSHGAIWRTPEGIAKILESYRAWSHYEAPQRVALFYDTMWHATERMTMAIEDGVASEGVECGVYRLTANPRSELARQVLQCKAFLVGSPTLNQAMFPTVGEFLTYIKGLKPKKRIAGSYGSFGWSGGACKQVDTELRALGLDMIESLECRYMPQMNDLDACHELGRSIARRVKGGQE